jgi:type IV pilus assembly protein PilA
MRTFFTKFNARGFTLIELLLVITIIIILASMVLIAINPARNIAQANNAKRQSNVNSILNAIHQYTIDNSGILPSTVSAAKTEICRTNAVSCSGLIDLSSVTFEERYILKMPTDPTSASTNGTGCFVVKDAYDRITVSAPFAQLGTTVEVSR